MCNAYLCAAQNTGDLDNTFNGNGKVTTPVGSLDAFGESVAVQSDGKIVVAGYADDGINYEFALVRYNSDGSLDDGFGTGGSVVTYYGDSVCHGYALAIQPDGKIVVAGTYYSGLVQYDDFMLARYNSNGTLDNTFGAGGVVTTDFGNSDDYGESVAIQSDGKIIVAGTSNIYNVPDNVQAFALARYNTNGALDDSFGVNGLVATNFLNSDNYGNSIVVQPDGNIVVAGSSSYSDSIVSIALVRYKTNGIVDSSFGINGIDTTLIGENASGNSIALQPDGKIVVAGYAGNNFAVLRYATNGIIDTTFGTNGKDTTGFDTLVATGNSLVIQTDSQIVVGGSIGSAFALVRYKVNGTPDSTFGTNGKVTTTFTGVDDGANSLALQPDGKIVAAGFTEVDTAYYFAVARYIPTITLGIVDVSVYGNSALIYPNPVNNEATLDYKLAKDETVSINLFDITGKLVQSITSNENMIAGEHRQTINLEPLPAGSYIVALTNANAQLVSIKIIKQ
jgi:uncharacterized delta-60 repeat protein